MEVELLKDGWSLSEKGLVYCKSLCIDKNPPKKDIIANALHTDIREIGKQNLPADINRAKDTEIKGPIVLQIQKIRNISAPNAKEDSSFAPRMLRLTFTDGAVNCMGIEIETISSLSLLTPPGSKVRLSGLLTVQHGFILLNNRNLELLGGDVEHLRTKWEISKNVNKLQRKVLTAEGGPPLFVPFEDSSFATRKPQLTSTVSVKVETSSKVSQKEKGSSMQGEKASKPFEGKKIWKSEPQKERKDKSIKNVNERDNERPLGNKVAAKDAEKIEKAVDKGRNERYFQPGSRQNDSVGFGREKKGSRDFAQNGKRPFEREVKKEDKRASKKIDDEFQAQRSGFEKEKKANQRQQTTRGDFEENKSRNKDDKYEKEVRIKQDVYKQKSGGRDERMNQSRKDLPPRMERLRQGRSNDLEEGRQSHLDDRKERKEFTKKSQEVEVIDGGAKEKKMSENPTDKDMGKVLDLLNEKMRIDGERGASKEPNMRGKQGYENNRYNDRNYSASENRGNNQQFGGKREKYRNNSNEMGQKKDERWANRRQEREGQRWQERGGQKGRDNGDGSYRNGRYESKGRPAGSNDAPRDTIGAYQNKVDDKSLPADTNVNKDDGGDGLQDSDWNNEQGSRPGESRHVDMQEQSDKVAGFMSAVMANSGRQMKGDFMMSMPRQMFPDHTIAQSSVPQPMITSAGSIMYNYVPSYPATMFQQASSQPYQPIPSQEFQGHGYQPTMQAMPQMGQYQQPPPTLYYQNVGLQNMNYQNQRMQPPGFGAQRGKPRVKHDVYRPKIE